MRMNPNRLCNWITLSYLCFGVFLMVVLVAQFSPDYEKHVILANSLSVQDVFHPVHFLRRCYYPLWHVLVAIVMTVFGWSGSDAAMVVSGSCGVIVFVCAWMSFCRKYGDFGVAMALSLLFFVVAPIYIPSFNSHLLVGQDSPNVWHNPTHLMVKAVAFPVLICFRSLVDKVQKGDPGREWFTIKRIGVLTVGILFATLAKPSFLQILFPAFCMLAVYKLVAIRSSAVKPIVAMSLAFVPSLMILTLQYALAFCKPGSDGGCTFAFLKYWRSTSPNVMISFLLVSMFPLIMLVQSILARKFSSGDALIWLMFAAGVLQKALLIEQGARMWHGNMTWGFSLAVFFIWFFAIDKLSLILADDNRTLLRRLALICALIVLVAHVLSGVCYVWRLLVLRQWA